MQHNKSNHTRPSFKDGLCLTGRGEWYFQTGGGSVIELYEIRAGLAHACYLYRNKAGYMGILEKKQWLSLVEHLLYRQVHSLVSPGKAGKDLKSYRTSARQCMDTSELNGPLP